MRLADGQSSVGSAPEPAPRPASNLRERLRETPARRPSPSRRGSAAYELAVDAVSRATQSAIHRERSCDLPLRWTIRLPSNERLVDCATETFRWSPKTGITSITIVALPFRTTRTTTRGVLKHDPGARHRPIGVGPSPAATGRAGRSAVLRPHSRASGSGAVSLAWRPPAFARTDRLMVAIHSREL